MSWYYANNKKTLQQPEGLTAGMVKAPLALTLNGSLSFYPCGNGHEQKKGPSGPLGNLSNVEGLS